MCISLRLLTYTISGLYEHHDASAAQHMQERMRALGSDFRGVCPISTAPMTNTNILEQAVALRA